MQMKRILIFVGDFYEDLELQYPKYRLMEEGHEVLVAGKERAQSYKGKYGYPCQADLSFEEAAGTDFDALVIPGGFAPDKWRMDPKVLTITKEMDRAKKPIAFICHGGWVPISAGILSGIKCTSYVAIKDDMVNAGANWTDEAVVVDGHLISSRSPKDLPHFCRALLKQLG